MTEGNSFCAIHSEILEIDVALKFLQNREVIGQENGEDLAAMIAGHAVSRLHKLQDLIDTLTPQK